MKENIKEIFEENKRLFQELEESGYVDKIEKILDVMQICVKSNHKILLAGNGGSAADAQHFAGEMVGRFLMEREAVSAIALTTDPSVVTCIANDYGYENVFARQIEGLGLIGDVFVAISISGNSLNLMKVLQTAKEKEMFTIGLWGKVGGRMKDLCDYVLIVPSKSTPRVQEIHTLTVHILCELLEKRLFEKEV